MDFQNLKKEPKLAICSISSLVGFVFNFLGICIAQAGQPFADFNSYGMQWYFLFFYLAWIAGMVGSLLTSTLSAHRHLLLAWTTLALAFMPFDIERSLFAALSRISIFGNGLKIAGLLLMIFPLFGALIFLGVEQTSPLHSLEFKIPSLPSNKEKEDGFQQPQAFVPPEPFVPSYDRKSESTLDNRISNQVEQIPSPELPVRTLPQISTAQPVPMTKSPEPMEFKARALYPCTFY
jgi:hypothetical protein